MIENQKVKDDALVRLVLKDVSTDRIAIRELPFSVAYRLRRGGMFLDGIYQPVPSRNIERIKVLPATAKYMRLCEYVGEPSNERFWQTQFGLGSAWSEIKHGWIAVVSGMDFNDRPVMLIMPHNGLIVSFFGGGSSKSLFRVVYDGPEAVIDQNGVDVHNRVVTIYTPKGSDQDLLLAARLAVSEAMRNAAEMTSVGLFLARKGKDKQTLIHLKTELPIQTETIWELQAVALPEYDGIRTLFVEDVLDCEDPLDVDRIEIVRPKSNRVSPENKSALAALENARRSRDVGETPEDQRLSDGAELVDDVDPLTGVPFRDQQVSQLYRHLHEKLIVVEGDHEVPAYIHARQKRNQAKRIRILDEFAVGERTASQSPALDLVFEDYYDSRPLPEEFKLALKAAKLTNLKFSTLAIRGEQRILDNRRPCTTELPCLLVNELGKPIINRWSRHRNKEEKLLYRRILGLEFLQEGIARYIFEIERFEDHDDLDYMTLALVSPDGGKLDAPCISDLFIDCAREKGVWRNVRFLSRFPHHRLLNRKGINDTGADEKPSAIAKRWTKVFEQLAPIGT